MRENMKYEAVIFDLDGTLIDTLEDLKDSINFALEQHGMPERSLEEVRTFVGNGVKKLVFRSVPENTSEELRESCLKAFKAHYITNSMNKTRPYNGICELIKKLKEKGVKLAVVTNKTQDAADAIMNEFFKDDFEIIIGQIDGVAQKPQPDGVWYAIEKLGASKQNSVYIGDSEVDCLTAKNSGIPIIGVTWGFRGRKVLEENNADYIVDSPEEILNIITR